MPYNHFAANGNGGPVWSEGAPMTHGHDPGAGSHQSSMIPLHQEYNKPAQSHDIAHHEHHLSMQPQGFPAAENRINGQVYDSARFQNYMPDHNQQSMPPSAFPHHQHQAHQYEQHTTPQQSHHALHSIQIPGHDYAQRDEYQRSMESSFSTAPLTGSSAVSAGSSHGNGNGEGKFAFQQGVHMSSSEPHGQQTQGNHALFTNGNIAQPGNSPWSAPGHDGQSQGFQHYQASSQGPPGQHLVDHSSSTTGSEMHQGGGQMLRLDGAGINPTSWREFNSVLTQPLDVSSLMLPELPAEGPSSAASSSFGFGLGFDASGSETSQDTTAHAMGQSRSRAHTTFSQFPSNHLPQQQQRIVSTSAAAGLMASPISSIPGSQLYDSPRTDGIHEGYSDSPALSTASYNMAANHPGRTVWTDSPQTVSSPSFGNQRIVSTPHRLQGRVGTVHQQHHHQTMSHSLSSPHNLGFSDYDHTDNRLSTAFANNAHISAYTPHEGAMQRQMMQQQQQQQQQQQGPSSMMIKEEDDSPFRFHLPTSPHLRQDLQGPMIMAQRGYESQGYEAEGASVIAPRRAAPSVRPSVFQQYSNLDRRVFEDRGFGPNEDCSPFIDDVMSNYLATPSRLGLGERSVVIMTSKVAQKSYGAEKRFLCPPPMVLLVGSSWWSACQENPTSAEQKEPTVLTPPRLSISMGSEDSMIQDSILEWASSSGKLLDTDNPSSEFAISGRSIGRQLFITDSDDKRKHCEALVHISVPTQSPNEKRSLGTFSSRPIKIISKPSKKRQSTRNTELGVLHGSTISLFHRLRSQTVSTRYLCVSGAPTWFKGSDGEPFLNTDSNTHIPNQGEPPSCFVAKTSSWDPFVVYLVDPSIKTKEDAAEKQQQTQQTGLRPPQYPPPPFNALPFGSGSQAIHYNQHVVLQCLNTAVVSPVMVIRKVERGASVIGGGQVPSANGGAHAEALGDPVSQLHKIALEVVDDASTAAPAADAFREGQSPGQSGHFLGCMNENVGLRKPSSPRQWCATSSRPTTPTTPLTPMMQQNVAPSTADTSLEVKAEPMSPTSMAAAYAAAQSRFAMNQRLAMSPTSSSQNISSRTDTNRGSVAWDDEEADESNAKRPRRVSSSVVMSQRGPVPAAAPSSASKNRRRGQSLSVVGLQNQRQQQQQYAQPSNHATSTAAAQRNAQSGSMAPPPSAGGSGTSSGGAGSDHLRRASSFAISAGGSETSTSQTSLPTSSMWSVDVHDSDIWTIVGVDIARHTFYLPPKLVGGVKGNANSVDPTIAHLVNVPAPCKPITPLPVVITFKPARGQGAHHGAMGRRRGVSESAVPRGHALYSGSAPSAAAAALAVTNGNLGKTLEYATLIGENLSTDLFVYFGDWRCTNVTAPSTTALLCAPPPSTDETGLPRGKVPITLVRRDGVIFPTQCIYQT